MGRFAGALVAFVMGASTLVGVADAGCVVLNNPKACEGRGGGGADAGDAPGGAFSINNVTKEEGTSEARTRFVFKVTRTGTGEASVKFRTKDGTAVSGSDYEARNGRLRFNAGQASRNLVIKVVADLDGECPATTGGSDPRCFEQFKVKLSKAVNGSIADGTGRGRILDDDQ